MAVYIPFQQIDPLAQFNMDYQLFLRDYGGEANPIPAGAPVGEPPVGQVIHLPALLQPAGVMVPAPPDPPLRPAVIVDQEHLMHRGEGVAIALVVVTALILRGWILISVILGLIVVAMWKYIHFRVNVARFYETERLRAEGRILPAAPVQQHYVINGP